MNSFFFKYIFPFLEKTLPKLGKNRIIFFGKLVGRMLWLLVRSRARLAQKAVETHLLLPPNKAKKIAKQSFIHNGQSFSEVLLVPAVTSNFVESNITFSDNALWERLVNTTTPAIATAAHLGAWEVMAGILGTAVKPGRSKAVVVREYKNNKRFDVTVRLRGSTGALVLGHRNAARGVLKILKKGGLVAFLVDHNCKKSDAIFLPFLNEIAAVNVGPAVLAVRSGASIWPVFLVHTEDKKYKMYIEEPLDTTLLEGSYEEKIEIAAKFYTNAVEKYVKLFPEQWFWMHKRWKTRP